MNSSRENIFVLDCSVTMSWLLLDEENPKTLQLQKQLITHNALVPTLWPYEVANVLCIALRKKRIDEALLEECKSVIKNLPIIIDDQSTNNTFNTSIYIANEHQLSIYDAAYLELSMREGLPLATFDQALRKAAQKSGVKLV